MISLLTISLLIATALVSGVVYAHDQGHGVVWVDGEIVATACSLDTSSRYQTIIMPTEPINKISNGEENGFDQHFALHLINCVTGRTYNDGRPPDKWKTFQVTFDGENDSGGFSVDDETLGIKLEIIDGDGVEAIPGRPLPDVNIELGSMKMNYTLRLSSNGKSPHAGVYNSTIRYKIDYY